MLREAIATVRPALDALTKRAPIDALTVEEREMLTKLHVELAAMHERDADSMAHYGHRDSADRSTALALMHRRAADVFRRES